MISTSCRQGAHTHTYTQQDFIIYVNIEETHGSGFSKEEKIYIWAELTNMDVFSGNLNLTYWFE